MAPINILFIVGVVTLPFVENAPSNILKTPSRGDFETRIVFIDEDADSAITGNSKILTRSKQLVNSPQEARTLEVKARKPSILSQMDDDRRIWGVAVDNTENIEDESYYNRPLSLPEFIPKLPSRKRDVIEPLEAKTPVNVPKPGSCDMAILICCQNSLKRNECFKSQGCASVTEDMFTYLCGSNSINRVIQDLGRYYKVNEN